MNFSEIVIALTLIASIVIFAVSANENINKYKCDEYSRITGKNTLYNNYDSCYVKTNDEYKRL